MPGNNDALLDMFEHLHRDYMKDIHLSVLEVRVHAQTQAQSEVAVLFESCFGCHTLNWLAQDECRLDPETVLRRTLRTIAYAEKLTLIVESLLETVKSGRPMSDAITLYKDVEFWGCDECKSAAPKADGGGLPTGPIADGAFLYNVLLAAKAISRLLGQLVWAALRAIPRFAALRSKFGFNFGGSAAGIQAYFYSEPDAKTLYELQEILGPRICEPWEKPRRCGCESRCKCC